ncbi:hypothetical protein JH146_1599 [Methanocaldococcus bathoardescens]|uniref:Uncharacterized protein n=1 Tax=Methanocaldococcus bathoardescens TaxID=1301915 RepID=A0A076LDZ0_9EURY|nr:hypothetical protein [Methanocaldococcus bathoardescens]AIJ06441.1 hypothetical protein JH146_1599 [Methanocaldococcus bathoardescens]
MQPYFTIKDLVEFINIKDDAKGQIFELIVWLALREEFELEKCELFDFKIKGTKTYIECKYNSLLYPNRYNKEYCQVYGILKKYLDGELERIYLATTKQVKVGTKGLKKLIKKYNINGFRFYIYELDILYFAKQAIVSLPIPSNMVNYLISLPDNEFLKEAEKIIQRYEEKINNEALMILRNIG